MDVDARGGASQGAGRPAAGGDPLHHIPTLEIVSRLCGGVAHDLNNLLTVIAGRCALALARIPAGEPVRRDLEVIQETADRAAGLADQLRAVSRRQRLQSRAVDLNTLVLEMADRLQGALGEGVELVIAEAAEPARVEADPAVLEQALMHLASVARDGMPEGGRFSVTFTRAGPGSGGPGGDPWRGPWLGLKVADTGPGLEPGTRDRLFEPFVPVAGRKRAPGLRLAAVQGIVEQSGGHVEAESPPGGGIAFSIFLPALASEPRPAPERAPEPVPAPAVASRSGSVVVVDDEPHVRDFAVEVLRRAGYAVLEAVNGVQALQLIEHCEEPVQLVVTDMVMPEMSGQELARRLAATHRGLKVLFISGFASDLYAPRSLADLDADFLAKPFSAEALTQKVRSLLG